MKKYDLNLKNRKREPVPELAPLCRRIAADGTVLLKNNGVLPFGKDDIVSVFGRTAFDYIASGTGSGGLVRTAYKTNVIDGFRRVRRAKLNESLISEYKKWLKSHPFDNGHGWATEPWFQVEYVPEEALIKKAASESTAALIVIGRLSGEDKDNSAEVGSYFLTDDETELIRRVTSHFDRVAVALNVGNIIDMSWVETFDVGAVLYLWQGGQEGGLAAADVLTGRVAPSGKLPDTVAASIDDYPSHKNFGDPRGNVYEEDIYVGYRYFETFAPEKVLFPFGFGLTYTDFDVDFTDAHAANGRIFVTACVKNVGTSKGKQTVQLYFGAPEGKLGKPSRQLAAYAKTKTLVPGTSQTLKLSFPIREMSSYDDSGATGHKSCYVLEAGDYVIFGGTDVRSAAPIFTYTKPTLTVTQKCTEALSPVREFRRMRNEGGKLVYEPTPMRTYDPVKRIRDARPTCAEFGGDRGIKLADVKNGRATMSEFTSQLTDAELACLIRGEGMGLDKVDVYTTAIFGGVTDTLKHYGISITTNSDGPSGIRSDWGEITTLMPNGTLIASTFDDNAVEELFVYEGVELYTHNLDALLGPGMNIHRHPCNGRNFEYFSEDPLLTGKMAAAGSRGISVSGTYATAKHFAANSQEKNRFGCDAVASERALREIYLRGFEIAVKEGGVKAIMTSYNPINGIQSASNYDLTTLILRGEWGYDGFVMTDWDAHMNEIGGKGTPRDRARMIRAQNDIYMKVPDSEKANSEDNVLSALDDGTITRAELVRCAENLLRYIMNTPNFTRMEKQHET